RLAGRVAGTPPLAVERHGENSRRGGLPGAPRSGEQIAVPDPAPCHRTGEGRGHVVLDQQLGEALGTVLAGEGDHAQTERRKDGKTESGNFEGRREGGPGGATRRLSTTFRRSVFPSVHLRECPRLPEAAPDIA